MSIYKLTSLLMALSAIIGFANAQSQEIFLNVPIIKESQEQSTVNYFKVNVEEKIPDLQFTIVATGKDRQSELEISIIINDLDKDFYQVIRDQKPNFFCEQNRNNVCVVPENMIPADNKLSIIIAIKCYMKCSYTLEALYIQMRQFLINSEFTYQKAHYNEKEDLSALSGWFNVPKDPKLMQIKLTVYEIFPNSMNLPINILMNPGKQGVSGNNAKYKSTQGVLNSAIVSLNQKDFKDKTEFSFVISFPSSSILLINLESVTGDMIKLNLNSFTQNELNTNEKMIYQIINPIGPNRIDPKNMSLVIKIVSQQGYGLIKLAGKNIPQSENDFILTSQENIFEQQLVVSSEMRKKYNLGDDLFHLMIEPVKGYILYLLEVYYEQESISAIQELEFNIQTHSIVNDLSVNQYKLIISGKTSFEIDIKQVHKEGSSSMIIKNCFKPLSDCKFTEEQIKDIISNQTFSSTDADIIAISQHKPIHDLKFTSRQDQCQKFNGNFICIYYIIVANHDNFKSRYMLLAQHSYQTTIIKDSEFMFGSVLPNHYKYYSYLIPSESNLKGPILYIKIVLSSQSKKCHIGVNISQQKNLENPTIEKADIYMKSDFIIIRQSEFGKLSEQSLIIFVYSEEYVIFNIQVTYHTEEKLSVKNLILNQYTTDIIDSYEASGVYAINIWVLPHQNSELKISLKSISGEFYFQYCKVMQKQQLQQCSSSSNNQYLVPNSQMKENLLQAYIQVIPLITPDKEMILTHSNLHFKIGIFLSDYVTEISKNEQNVIDLKLNEQIFVKIMISSGDILRIFMFSDNETAQGNNAIAYLSYDYLNIKPTSSRNNQILNANAFIKIDSNLSEQICSKPTEERIECFIFITFIAIKTNTQVTFNANKQESIVRLYNKIVHKDEYPQDISSYHRYYYSYDKKIQNIFQTSNSLSKLDIFINFIDLVKEEQFYFDDETYYPIKERYDFKLEQSGDPSMNIIDFDSSLFDSSKSKCKGKLKCLVLISIKLNDESENKKLKEEYYIVRVFSNEIKLERNQRQIYMIKKGFDYYFKLSITPQQQHSTVHVNPIGICDVQITLIKLGQKQKFTYTEKGGNLIVIDKSIIPPNETIQGEYLVTVSTTDNFCQFYIVNYDSPFQYVKVEAGHYFHSNLEINQQLFLEYTDISPLSFRVETSIEEGTIKMGIVSEKNSFQWSPERSILSYTENNLQNTRKQSLIWRKEKHGQCDRCKFIIAINAVRETRLSVVVKNDETYSTVPAQRMFKIEAQNNTRELFHFYPHMQRFSMQVTLLSGKITVFGNEGYEIVEREYTKLYTFSGTYQSKEVSFTPSLINEDTQFDGQIDSKSHSRPFSFMIKIESDSVLILSFQSNQKTIHLASGFPYFKQLDSLSSLELQYKSIQSGYSKSTEFTIYLQNEIYHAGGISRVEKTIEKYNSSNENKANNSTISWQDFYPTISIENFLFKKQFLKNQLSPSAILYTRESESGTFTMKVTNDAKGLLELDERIYFYVIAHSGTQHLLQNTMIQKNSLQGSFDSYEFYMSGEQEIVIELIQCYGQSIPSISDDSTGSFGSHQFQVISEHPNLYYAKIETGADMRDKQDMNYFFTVQNLLESTYRIRANVYPSQTVYPYQMYTSGNYFEAAYNSDTKMLDSKFDGLKCVLSCDNPIFQLMSVEYVFDSDYNSINYAQGNALCSYPFYDRHLKVIKFNVNILDSILNKSHEGNQIEHSNVTTSLHINDILDKNAAQLRVSQFYLSLVAKAHFINMITKKEEVFYFPYKTHTLDVKWIENERQKNNKISLVLGLVFGGLILAVIIGFFIYKWYKKSRRNIHFEISDAQNTSTTSPRHNSLQVNLNHNVEMKKYEQNYSHFQDEQEQHA